MADRSFVRDALGRFARAAGKAAAKEAKKFAREEAEDAKRVAKAKLASSVADAKAELAAAQTAARQQELTRSDVETDSDASDFEVARKKARDAVRRAKLKLAALKSVSAAAN